MNAEEFVSSAEAVQSLKKNEVIPQPQWQDKISIIIPARGGKEYKLYLEKNATFEYAWQTNSGELFFDFHGEPAGDTTGYFKSFKKNMDEK